MKRKNKTEFEKFISRSELIELRGLSLKFIQSHLKNIEYSMGYRTKKYKLSEVDALLEQMRAG